MTATSFFGTGEITDLDGQALTVRPQVTHLPVGTRVRVVDFAPDYDGLTAVVTGTGSGEFADWTAVAMDRRVVGNAGLMFRPQYLVELPAPTVSLVKADPQADPFGDLDAPLVDPRPAGFLAEAAAAFTSAVEADPQAVRLAHLEEMQVLMEAALADQAALIAEQAEALRIVRQHRDELVVRSEEVAELRGALQRAQARALTASEAADAYRQELASMRGTLRAIGQRVDAALTD